MASRSSHQTSFLEPIKEENASSKDRLEQKAESSQKVTAAGSSAMNTSLFIQNALQLKHLLSLKSCSKKYKELAVLNQLGPKTIANLQCDPWSEQSKMYQGIISGIGVSLFLGLAYGVITITEFICRNKNKVGSEELISKDGKVKGLSTDQVVKKTTDDMHAMGDAIIDAVDDANGKVGDKVKGFVGDQWKNDDVNHTKKDLQEMIYKKNQKSVHRTVAAIIAFILALLNIGIEAFMESVQ